MLGYVAEQEPRPVCERPADTGLKVWSGGSEAHMSRSCTSVTDRHCSIRVHELVAEMSRLSEVPVLLGLDFC